MLLSAVHSKISQEIADPNYVSVTKVHLTEWVNEAVRHLARQTGEHELEVSIPVIAGTESYAMAANAVKITRIENEFKQKIENVQFESFQKMAVEPLTLGSPIYWYEHTERIYFWPVPTHNASYTLWYTGLPDDLVTPADDAEQLPLPASYHDTICTYVRMRANERLGDLESALFAKAEVQERISQDREEAYAPEANEYPSIRVADPYAMMWD